MAAWPLTVGVVICWAFLPSVEAEQQQVPTVAFTDITTVAGISWVHNNGATGDKFLPETMGGGVAFFDADNDSDPDLFLVNSTDWPHDMTAGSRSTSALYLNAGNGKFAEDHDRTGLDMVCYGMGIAVADCDGDGWTDVLVTALGPNRFLSNRQGVFEETTNSSGLAGSSTAWSSSAGFFDADNDGDLDLFVANYLHWSLEMAQQLDFRQASGPKAYGLPTNFFGSHPYFYRNEGLGQFVERARESGFHLDDPRTGTPVGKALGLTLVDVDEDGRIDLLVANDTARNFLFRNLGGGLFGEMGEQSGLAYDTAGRETGSMGVDFGHFAYEGSLGIAVGNFAYESSSLYVRQARPAGFLFADRAANQGLSGPTWRPSTFGLFFFDYDLDSRLDLLQINGHIESDIANLDPTQTYRQRPQLFWNTGPAQNRQHFVLAASKADSDWKRPLVGRGAAFSDIDSDGDLDVVATQVGMRPVLWRNDQQLTHHWLRVELEGRSPNRDAIGAQVLLSCGGETQRRTVMPTRSYLSQVEPVLTFGLGKCLRADKLTVTWPDGTTQVLVGVETNHTVVVVQEVD